jgi:RNA polymerase sigma-70 factor (ECF subfamily)
VTEERKERFLALLEPVYPRLSRYALAITRDREEARDLVGESVLRALERFDTLRDESSFAGFLFRIASHTHKRAHYRERMKQAFDPRMTQGLTDQGTSPERSAEAAIVMAALDSLPEKIKETILLFDIADLSLEEVRKIQGGTLSGVKSRLKRGHEALKQNLGVDREPTQNFDFMLLKGAERYAI